MSAKLSWEARAAKREIAEFALRKAVEHIESQRGTGGPTSGPSHGYRRALSLARHAERELRLSEGIEDER